MVLQAHLPPPGPPKIQNPMLARSQNNYLETCYKHLLQKYTYSFTRGYLCSAYMWLEK